MTVPVLPESAPFSPAQRAWLNGFFAGLLGLEAGGSHAQGNGNGNGATLATSPAEVEEDFPWHDPALPLADRLELAEGRPYPRRLMAAMAQLDCGACGYLCKTYSEAIARGEEKDLNRCTPGGKETSRKLKELVAAQGAVTTNGSAMTSVAAGNGSIAATTGGAPLSRVVVRPTFSRSNPFPTRLVESRPLNREGSKKDTRHVVIDLAGSGLTYKPGDALGVYPENCPDLVDEVLRELNAGGRLDLRPLLLRNYSLGRPVDDLIECLVECATSPDEAGLLTRIRDGEDTWIDTADLLDILRRHPSARIEADQLLELLPPLQPRLYSISSSPRAQLPDSGDTPMIMVGPGTGVAPFRAFLEERRAASATGKNWLFFGDQCRATDYLYEQELHEFQAAGVLTRLDLAFSRDQAEKVYVQDRMLERARELWNWLEEGAHFYVCGDAKRMANDVDHALQQIVATQGGLSAGDAKAYVTGIAKSGRYQRDVY